MRAELRWIEANDYPHWDAFISSDPFDGFGWFTVSIGPEGEDAAESFQVLVSTPAAVGRAQGDATRFRGLVIGRFEPAVVRDRLRQYVSNISGDDWIEVVKQLRSSMHWEYEGIHPHLVR